MGVYKPVYLLDRDFNPRFLQAHGGGGEHQRGGLNYYHAFSDNRLRGDLSEFKDSFSPEEFVTLQEQVLAELDSFRQANPELPVDISHYRQFRNRMHFGHRPHRKAMYTPLNSVLLDRVYDSRRSARPDQVLFDVMESLAPGLKDLPFDNPSKAPSDETLRNLTTVSLSSAVTPGRTFLDAAEHEQAMDTESRSRAYALWIDEASEAIQDQDVRSFLGPERLSICRSEI